jgi:hypothetical protein
MDESKYNDGTAKRSNEMKQIMFFISETTTAKEHISKTYQIDEIVLHGRMYTSSYYRILFCFV